MRILATIGTTQFDQLIDALYDNADEIFKNDQLILQYGQQDVSNKKQKQNVTFIQFIKNLPEEIAKSDLIISTASAGSRLDTILAKKPHIMVCNDSLAGNHQLEMVEANRDNKTCLVFDNNKQFEKWLQTNPNIQECVDTMNDHIQKLQEPKDLTEFKKIYNQLRQNNNKKEKGLIIFIMIALSVVSLYLFRII